MMKSRRVSFAGSAKQRELLCSFTSVLMNFETRYGGTTASDSITERKCFSSARECFDTSFFPVKWIEGGLRELCNFGNLDEGFGSQIDKYFRFKLLATSKCWKSKCLAVTLRLSHAQTFMSLVMSCQQMNKSCVGGPRLLFLWTWRPRQDVDIHHILSTT